MDGVGWRIGCMVGWNNGLDGGMGGWRDRCKMYEGMGGWIDGVMFNQTNGEKDVQIEGGVDG